MNSCRNIALTFDWHLIIKGNSSTASTIPYPPISLAADNKMMFLTKENKKTPTNKSPLLYVHLNMEYLTAGGLVTYSTSDTFYTSTEMAITILCKGDLQSDGHLSYVIVINIFISTICQ